jgi:GNAT superfamily N-acetyltransferase
MEAAEEYGALRYAQAVKPEHPDWGTAWEEFGGGHLVFVQRVSPVGRAHGLGFGSAAGGPAEKDSARRQTAGAGCEINVTAADVAHIEDFYFSREADAQVDVCPYADPSLFAALNERGFQVAEFNQTLARWISPDEKFAPANEFLKTAGASQTAMRTAKTKTSAGSGVAKKTPVRDFSINSSISIRHIQPSEAQAWSAAAAQIFFGDEAAQWENLFIPWSRDKDALCLAAFAQSNDDTHTGEKIVGTAGGLIVRPYNMCGFWGAATLPEFRGLGIQRAFLQERLRLAQLAGCDLAVTLTLPGTTSQRNAERAGFRTAYTKVVTIKRHPRGKGVYVEVPYGK